MKVLYTEANGFGAVFTRVLDFPKLSRDSLEFIRTHGPNLSLWYNFVHPGLANSDNQRAILYNPRPGTAEAVGCWSLLEDARRCLPLQNLAGIGSDR